MTQQEKDEFNKRHFDNISKGRKSKIVCAIVFPLVGIIITVLIGFAQKSRQSDIASATVLDSQSVGDFIDENENGTAIYTGAIYALDPVSVRGEREEYIEIRRKVEREEKIYNEETDKYETETTTMSNDSAHCDEIEIDDAIAGYRAFHSLPTETETYSEGANSNKIKTTYSYVPAKVEGTFLIKVKNGEISSADYYASTDVEGESRKGFGIVTVLIWLAIIALEIYLIVKIVSATKILNKNR